MAENCSETRLNISCTAVELPMKVALIFSPTGGMSQMLQARGVRQRACGVMVSRGTGVWLLLVQCKGCMHALQDAGLCDAKP